MKTAKNTSLNISNADLTALLLSLMIHKKKYMSITFSLFLSLSLSRARKRASCTNAKNRFNTNELCEQSQFVYKFMFVLVNRMHTSCKSCVHNFSHVICIVPKFIDVM